MHRVHAGGEVGDLASIGCLLEEGVDGRRIVAGSVVHAAMLGGDEEG